MQKIVCIIPARLSSSRFPRKMLAQLNDSTVIEHVIRGCTEFIDKGGVLVLSSPDSELLDLGRKYGLSIHRSSEQHVRALERVGETASHLQCKDDDIVICVQGDEPLVRSWMLEEVIKPIMNGEAGATMAVQSISTKQDFLSKHIVKVVFNRDFEVLYTSRSPIPTPVNAYTPGTAYRIVGIFAFKYALLNHYCMTPESRLEKMETCDSNRILDLKWRQQAVPIERERLHPVDVIEDLERIEKLLEGREND